MKLQFTFKDKEIGKIVDKLDDETFAIVCNFINGSIVTVEIDTDTGDSRIVPVDMGE